MVGHYVYGFCAAVFGALVLGYPIAAACGLGRGWRAIGYASAIGTSLLLIACRGAQMLAPLETARWLLLGGVACVLAIAWSPRTTREQAGQLLHEEGRGLLILLAACIVVGVLLGAPILFGNAIQFDGTRNTDSFTFTSSARYMLGHAFHGAPDFSPEHPVYTISRNYFGDDPMQPRPAAEGLLAWLSAMAHLDPVYLYNAVQAAGVVLSGLAVLAFLPAGWKPRGARPLAMLVIFALASPTLLHVAINSNFANALNLPAATAYVALGLAPRTRGTFMASVVSLGCLLSGYPELLTFVIAARALGVVMEAVASRSVIGAIREAGWMVGELLVACAVLPWATMGAVAVFRTSLGVSKAGASELGGNMYAGLPLFAATVLALVVSWRSLASVAENGRRGFLLGVLAAFALAQAAMIARGFDYGGFKVSQYFVTLLAGVLVWVLVGVRVEAQGPHLRTALTIAIAVLMAGKSIDVLHRGWTWSEARRVTPDLIKAGEALPQLSRGQPVAIGNTPQPFYDGMWIAYLTTAPVAYDVDHAPESAGYLLPYLLTTTRAQALYDQSTLQLDIGTASTRGSTGAYIARFGDIRLIAKNASSAAPDGSSP